MESIWPTYKLYVNEYCDDHRDLVENIRLTLKNCPTDFTIEVGDKKYPVHKLIIAMHSAYLAKLVSYGEDIPTVSTTSLRHIFINDFATILKWMYSGEIILQCNNVITLYATAKIYDIPRLLTLCTKFMHTDPACTIIHVWRCIESCYPYFTKRDGIELINSLLIDAADDPNFAYVTEDILWGIFLSPHFKLDSENLTLWVILRWILQDLPSRLMAMPDILHFIHRDKIQGSTVEEVMENCNVNVEGMLSVFREAVHMLDTRSPSPSVSEYMIDDMYSSRFSESSDISEDDSSAIQPIVQEDATPVIVGDEREISSPTDMAEIVSSGSTNSSEPPLPTPSSSDDHVDRVAPVGHSLLNAITTVYGDTYKQETQASFAKDGNTVVAMERQSSDPQGANVVGKMKSEISRKFSPKMISGAQALLLEMDVKCPGLAGHEGILMSMQVTVDSAMLSCDIEPQDPPRDSMVSMESEGSQKRIKLDDDEDSTDKVADADSKEIADDVEPSTESSTSDFNYSNMLP